MPYKPYSLPILPYIPNFKHWAQIAEIKAYVISIENSSKLHPAFKSFTGAEWMELVAFTNRMCCEAWKHGVYSEDREIK